MSSTLAVHSNEEIYRWLREQAEELGLSITLFPNEAQMKGNWLYLPVYIENAIDSYDNALKLQRLEDTRNDQEPQQEFPIFLVPAKNPLRQAAMDREFHALQRKMKAVAAFGKAANLEEKESAAAEFREAEQAEAEAHRAYEQIAPWNERVPD